MKARDCPQIMHATIVRLANELKISADNRELRLSACAVCIESSLSTWIAMWEDNSLTRKDLLMFFDHNFRWCLQVWIQISLQISDEIGSASSELVSKLHSLVLQIESENCPRSQFDLSVICALLASMVARQAFVQGTLPEGCFDNDFQPFSPSIHKDFFKSCLSRAEFPLSDPISLRALAKMLIDLNHP